MNRSQSSKVLNFDPLPVTLRKEIAGYAAAPNPLGMSSSQVYQLTHPQKTPLYLKFSPLIDLHPVRDDYERLLWLAGKLPVPEVVAYVEDEAQAYLLITTLPGVPTNSLTNPQEQERAVHILAEGMHILHALPPDDCPFDQNNDRMIAQAEHNLRQGWVEEWELDEKRRGREPASLMAELRQVRPFHEERVFTHGDYCLPNILIHNGQLSGFIDVGMAGLSDRYRDLALCTRSLTYNYGAQWVPLFHRAYGLEPVDEAKISFYKLLDEFF